MIQQSQASQTCKQLFSGPAGAKVKICGPRAQPGRPGLGEGPNTDVVHSAAQGLLLLDGLLELGVILWGAGEGTWTQDKLTDCKLEAAACVYNANATEHRARPIPKNTVPVVREGIMPVYGCLPSDNPRCCWLWDRE